MENIALSGISENRRHLIEMMLEINFGQIKELHIKGGEPVFDPPPKTIRGIVIGKENHSDKRLKINDFYLKSQVREFFEVLDNISDGVIHVLAVQNGLPVHMKLEK